MVFIALFNSSTIIRLISSNAGATIVSSRSMVLETKKLSKDVLTVCSTSLIVKSACGTNLIILPFNASISVSTIVTSLAKSLWIRIAKAACACSGWLKVTCTYLLGAEPLTDVA